MDRIIIMGAAGRDFHNFNVYFRDNPAYQVVAFTATQIPGIGGRTYPPSLAGELYPKGIPIHPEEDLPRLIKEYQVDQIIFAYSDVPHTYVMHQASLVLACGADFRMMGPKNTLLKSKRPVVAVTAVRTGAGKSQTSRYVAKLLAAAGKNVVIVRHPMPYSNLEEQRLQRFATYEDLNRYHCTIEEREEYEPHLDNGLVVYAGVDYQAILEQAETEADIIIWDGGNNDLPFFESDLHIVVLDPLRSGNESSYHPGETNLRMADVAIINKINTAEPGQVKALRESLAQYNPSATVIHANSFISVDKPELVKGKKVLVIEDGPSLTHGQMSFGAGIVAAKEWGAEEIIVPHPYAVGSIADILESWPQLTNLIPAMGYSPKQVEELQQTIDAVPADAVVMGTPIDLSRIMDIEKPVVRVRYELQEIKPMLKDILKEWMR